MNDNENKTNAPTINLLPCPFCGGKAEMTRSRTETIFSNYEYVVSCTKEGVCMGKNVRTDDHGFAFAEDAIAQWNTRNEADALRAEVEGMREFIESMEIAHFTHNGKPAVIYKDDETYTLLAQAGGDSKGHTHVWDAYAAIKPNAAAGETGEQNGSN